MNYPSPGYAAAPAVAAKGGAVKTVLIVAGVVLGTLVFLGALGIGLGVGLGVGLNKNKGSSSTLSSPTVTCNTSATYCGCPTTAATVSSRMFSGSTSTVNSWPWMAVVNVGSRVCSGFLVSDQDIVTAANCVYGKDFTTISVYLGVTKRSDTTNSVTRGVANITIPSGYSTSSSDMDIAVIKLDQNVNLTSNIGICCYFSNTTTPAAGENGIIAGWGEVSLISSPSDSLQQAVVQVKDPSTCGLSANSTRFCAGYAAVETCPADNGGPLMTSSGDYWTCSGIIIGGSSACYQTGIYTRVGSYNDFISSAIYANYRF